jgi:hypothetical protein
MRFKYEHYSAVTFANTCKKAYMFVVYAYKAASNVFEDAFTYTTFNSAPDTPAANKWMFACL